MCVVYTVQVQRFVSEEVKPALTPYTAALSTMALLDL